MGRIGDAVISRISYTVTVFRPEIPGQGSLLFDSSHTDLTLNILPASRKMRGLIDPYRPNQ
jgi:hypothetical protein